MEQFTTRHGAAIVGVLEGFDRLLLRGTGLVLALLSLGGYLNLRDGYAHTPLYLARRLRHSEVVAILRRADAVAEGEVLHNAARVGDTAVLLDALFRGAHPNAKDQEGWTPLHLAARHGQAGAVDVLLGAGAAVDAWAAPGVGRSATPASASSSAGVKP